MRRMPSRNPLFLRAASLAFLTGCLAGCFAWNFGQRPRESSPLPEFLAAPYRQPSGALSDVTLFCGAGHGWTADAEDTHPADGDRGWWTQRPLTFGMVEDLGNLDQLEIFAECAWRAGATVIPFRGIGAQPIEILLDNENPNVSFHGAWRVAREATLYYGPLAAREPCRIAETAPRETATARFAPSFPEAGFYPVYVWADYGPDHVRQLYRVAHSGGVAETRVNHRRAGRGWIWIGMYHFEAGRSGYVEISNEAADGEAGVVVADAVRFGVGMGDIDRGAGVSGHMRGEEASLYWIENMAGPGAARETFARGDLDDYSNNVGAPARMSAHMNNEADGGYYDRFYLGFHTNASSGGALRGAWGLYNNEHTLPDQQRYATFLCEEIERDMERLDEGVFFSADWKSGHSGKLYGYNYGEIRSTYNNSEMNATIIETAFHDNPYDAEILKDPKARLVIARSSLNALIRYRHTATGGAGPLVFPPDPPTRVRVSLEPGGRAARAQWAPPPRESALGDPPEGYVIYRSVNGRGFGAPIRAQGGDTTEARIEGLTPGKTLFLQIAAWNAGGESLPSDVLAVRSSPAGLSAATGGGDGAPGILLVQGFDRLDPGLSPRQRVAENLGGTKSPGGVIERINIRRMNALDSLVPHALALEFAGASFESCSNEAVAMGDVLLAGRPAVIWACGQQKGPATPALTLTDLTLLTDYLDEGGRLFLSGSDLVSDLASNVSGAAFCREMLRIELENADAQAWDVEGARDSIFAGMSRMAFSVAGGALYEVREPDQFRPLEGAAPALRYRQGGRGGDSGGGVAAVQAETDGGAKVIVLGFPFEALGDSLDRGALMALAMDYFGVPRDPSR